MLGGVGLLIASPDTDGLVWTTPDGGGAQAASEKLSTRLIAAQRMRAA